MILTENAVHASESQHWYFTDGSPCYEVKNAKGGMRPTTLRDARKLNLVPSVTTIIKSAAAPGLELWKANQLMMSALTLPRLPDEPENIWIGRVKHDSREQGREASARGTAIHAAIQQHYEQDVLNETYYQHVIGTKNAIHAHFSPSEWKAEKSFAHYLGFGGKTDLSASGVVIDIKTKEFDADTKLDTWDEHAMQLAAYRMGLGMPEARCAIVYVSATVPGLARVIELDATDIKYGWYMFLGLLRYWKAKNRYWPAEPDEAADD